MQFARGHCQPGLWVKGGAVRLQTLIVNVLYVPLLILRLVSLDSRGRWHLFHVVSPLPVRSNLSIPST